MNAMTEPNTKRLNWWAGVFAFMFLLPIAWLSFDNAASAFIMAGTAGAVGLFLFPVRKR